MSITIDNALAVLKLFGTSDDEQDRFLQEIERGDEFSQVFGTALTYTPASIYTDWKYHPADVLEAIADCLRARRSIAIKN